MNRLLMVGSALSAFALPAAAADLALKAPMAPSPVAYNWSGCYVGGNAGGQWSRSQTTMSLDPGTHLARAPNIAAVGLAGTGTADDYSFIGGGQVGCNLQAGAWVLGIEGDYQGQSANPTLRGANILTTGDAFLVTNSVSANWLATTRGRIGYTFDRLMFYGTGGAAFAHLTSTQTYSSTLAAAVGSSTASSSPTGWTVGGGWEYALTDRWSYKFEYLYTKFSTLSTVGGILSATGHTNVLHGSGDLTENVMRFGVNYRLF